jgi:hypothetical protein
MGRDIESRRGTFVFFAKKEKNSNPPLSTRALSSSGVPYLLDAAKKLVT